MLTADFIPMSDNMQTTQIYVSRWKMDEKIVVYAYTRKLHSSRKEWIIKLRDLIVELKCVHTLG